MATEFEEPSSRNIPLPIKREVRQRCGFGCVLCGVPVYEYEHMDGWASVRRHEADQITLLCAQHHAERTKGLLTIQQVRQASKDPFNLRHGKSPAYQMHFAGGSCLVDIGSNRFSTTFAGDGRSMTALMIDDVPLIGFSLDSGQLLLNMLVYNESNERVLEIVESQLVYTGDGVWDVEFVGQTLTIREGLGDFLLEVTFQPPNRIAIGRSRIVFDGVECLVRPQYLLVVNNCSLISHTQGVGLDCGIAIDSPSYVGGVCFAIGGVPRYPFGSYDVEKRKAAIEWAESSIQSASILAAPRRAVVPPISTPGLEALARAAVAQWRSQNS